MFFDERWDPEERGAATAREWFADLRGRVSDRGRLKGENGGHLDREPEPKG